MTTAEQVICSECGKVHPIEDIELVFGLPDVIFALAKEERNTRCHISSEVCVLDHERFFLRGILPFPVSDRETRYSLGVWAELSLETYKRVYLRWNDEDQRDEPRLPGTLANEVPLQDSATLGLNMSIQLIGLKKRPEFYVEVEDHSLYREQNQGIDSHRALQYSDRTRGSTN